MPYIVRKEPLGGYRVYVKGTNRALSKKAHKTRAAAVRQMQAVIISEKARGKL